MQHVWAPWRMEYILASKQAGCFLCEAAHANADRDLLVLRRQQHSFVILNRYPYTNGHCMVAPYRHVSELSALEDAELLELMQAVRDCVTILRQTMGIHGANVGINLGAAAGAGLAEHLHIHIVPRWQGDTNFMPVLADTRIMPQSLLQNYDQLLPAFQADQPPSSPPVPCV